MKVRFQADADLHAPIIKGLRRREAGVDFTTAHEAGLAGLDDRAVLTLAASNGRVLVSHDVSTMPEAFSAFLQEQTSPGLILISSGVVLPRSDRGAIARLDKHRGRGLAECTLIPPSIKA